MTQASMVYAQESMGGHSETEGVSLPVSVDSEAAQVQTSSHHVSIRLTEQQAQALTRIAIPNGLEQGMISGPDWAVMIGLEVHDAFWDTDSQGVRAYLPHGDTLAEVSARGCNGIRNTRVLLKGDILRIESNGNSPINARDLAATLATSVEDDAEPVDLPDAWLEADRAQDRTTTYPWPEGRSVDSVEEFDAALRELDPHLAVTVRKLRDQANITPYSISRSENRLARDLSMIQAAAHNDFDYPLESFAAAAAQHIHAIAAARRAEIDEKPPAEPSARAHESEPLTDVSPQKARAAEDPRDASPADPSADDQGTQDREAQLRRVADMLLSRHMDQVEDELELFKARISGAFRVLDEAAIGQSHQDYQRWEKALQRLEGPYQAVSRYAEALAATPQWQQIERIWKHLQRLAQHLQDDIIRFGAPILHRLDDRLTRIVATSATAIGDLSALVGTALPDPSGPQLTGGPPILEAVQALTSAGHSIAADLSRLPAAEPDAESQSVAPEASRRSGADRPKTSPTKSAAQIGPLKDRRGVATVTAPRARLATAPGPPKAQPQPGRRPR